MCGFPLFKCSFPTVGFYMFLLGMFGSPWFKQTAQLVDVLHFTGPNKNWRPRMSSSRCATVRACAGSSRCRWHGPASALHGRSVKEAVYSMKVVSHISASRGTAWWATSPWGRMNRNITRSSHALWVMQWWLLTKLWPLTGPYGTCCDLDLFLGQKYVKNSEGSRWKWWGKNQPVWLDM